jgi:hypothetical protein
MTGIVSIAPGQIIAGFEDSSDEVTNSLVSGSVAYANSSGQLTGSAASLLYRDDYGSLNIGVTASIGASTAGIGLGNNRYIYGRNAANTSWAQMLGIKTDNFVQFGITTTFNSIFAGATIYFQIPGANSAFIGGDGGWTFGSAVAGTALGAEGIGLANGKALYCRNFASGAWLNMIGSDTTNPSQNNITVGNTSATVVTLLAANLRFYANASQAYFCNMFTSAFQFRSVTNAAGISSSLQACNGQGTNIAGGDLVLYGGPGTGNAAPGIVKIATYQSGASSATEHSTVHEMAHFNHCNTDSDTALLLKVNKSGVQSIVRVQIGATGSGGTGKRALVIDD